MASTSINPSASQKPAGSAGGMVSKPGSTRTPCIPCSKKGR